MIIRFLVLKIILLAKIMLLDVMANEIIMKSGKNLRFDGKLMAVRL